MLSALQIYLTAPLGSLIRYASGEPRPPERFTRKVRAWQNENGAGRLVDRQPGYCGGTTRHPATFKLHVGNFGAHGTIILSVSRIFSAESAKSFEILENPESGAVRILTSSGGHDELRFLAADMEEAKRWMAEHHFSNMGPKSSAIRIPWFCRNPGNEPHDLFLRPGCAPAPESKDNCHDAHAHFDAHPGRARPISQRR